MQEISSDKRIDGEITPDKKTEEERANENSQLTYKQPGDKRLVKNKSTNSYAGLHFSGCDQ